MNRKPFYEGYFDRADCQAISGWAWDSNNPDIPVALDIYADNILLHRVLADEFRKDLKDAGKGDGCHGFTYDVPDQLKDEKPHSISVKVARTEVALVSSPMEITCKFGTELNYLETHLVDHCNLNCRGCSHFCPLSEQKFTDFDVFKKDFLRLRQLFDNISLIRLLGGEPLLHPELLKFLEFTRSLFPDSFISIVTNGTLLLKQPDKFWKECSKNRIWVQISQYPIKYDLETIKKRGKTFNVEMGITQKITHLYKFINMEGDSDPAIAFSKCRSLVQCTFLEDGKIYPCWVPPTIHNFNKYFDKNIPVTEADYINIHDNIKGPDIMEFINRPIPMCRWCLTNWPVIKWEISKKEISEWTGVNPSSAREVFNHIKRSSLDGSSGSITANPNPIEVNVDSFSGITTLQWTSEGTEQVEVHIDTPDGPLFSRSGSSGSKTTGKWVRDQMVFYLQDVSGGKLLTKDNTLDKVRVNVLPKHFESWIRHDG